MNPSSSCPNWRDGSAPRDGDRIVPGAPRFARRVFVLIGATNSSATFDFARTVKRAGLATLVGQPTGGNVRGINGGAFFFLRLPNSRIELDLPLIGYFPEAASPPDQGVDPDVLVERTVQDISTNVDAQLGAVRQELHSPARTIDRIGQSGRFLRS